MMIHCRKCIFFAILFTLLNVYSASCQAFEEATCQRVDELLLHSENQQAWELLQGLSRDGIVREEISWRMARTQYEMGRLTESDEKALVFFQEAERYARVAIKEAPDKSDGYKWLAIALGAQAKYTDTETRVRQSWEIKESIEKAIVLNPDDDVAYLILSRWHYKISEQSVLVRAIASITYGELPKASLKEAEDLLLQAIGLHDRIAHRYNLAKVYDRMGRHEDAVTQYVEALRLPVTFPEEAEELEKVRNKQQKWQRRAMTSQ